MDEVLVKSYITEQFVQEIGQCTTQTGYLIYVILTAFSTYTHINILCASNTSIRRGLFVFTRDGRRVGKMYGNYGSSSLVNLCECFCKYVRNLFSERKMSRSETEAWSPTRRNQAKTHAAGRGGIPSPYKRWARQGTNDWSRGSPSVYDLPLPPVHPFSFPLAQTKRIQSIQSSAPDRIEPDRTDRRMWSACRTHPSCRGVHGLHPATGGGRWYATALLK